MADSQADAVQTPIMKVDSPSEDNENDDNEVDVQNEMGHSICSPSRPIIQSSRFGSFSNPFAPKVSSTSMSEAGASKSVLRPSQLSQQVASSNKPFSLNPSKLNPIAKITTTTTEELEPDDKKVQMECTNGETPKFVPLITSSADKPRAESSNTPSTTNTNNVPAQSTTTNFVFGQNLQERVISDANCTSSNNSCPDSSSDECKPSTSVSTNGTAAMPKDEMLFSSAIKETPMHDPHVPIKSLNESAREYEEQRNNKRKYEEVETKTGEEDETNVMQISCKLFAFDKGIGNWQERGRGTLRLNDLMVKDNDNDGCYIQSRLVFRNSGVHKVILNTKIWAEMTVEQPSAKSIRFTAINTAGEIKVYLVMASGEEIKHLYKLLQDRRGNEQKRQSAKRVSPGSTIPPLPLHLTHKDSNVSTTSASVENVMLHEDDETVDDDQVTNGNRDTRNRDTQESVIKQHAFNSIDSNTEEI